MPSRAYDGSVSIIQNTAGTIVIEADSAGAWSNDNATECLAKMLSFGKELGAEVKVFYGKGRKTGSIKTDAVEIKEYVNKEGKGSGKPYMSLLPKGKSSAVRKIKLA